MAKRTKGGISALQVGPAQMDRGVNLLCIGIGGIPKPPPQLPFDVIVIKDSQTFEILGRSGTKSENGESWWEVIKPATVTVTHSDGTKESRAVPPGTRILSMLGTAVIFVPRR